MARRIWAAALALLLLLGSVGRVGAESASIAVSVTVAPAKLQGWVEPGCVFSVEKKTKTVECTTTIIVAQMTFQFEGWELSLAADALRDPESGRSLPASALQLVSMSGFHVYWGQPVDRRGGPFVPASAMSHALNKERTVIAAKPGHGIGGYETTVRFRLTVPKNAKAGTYVPSFEIGASNAYDGGSGHSHGNQNHQGDDDQHGRRD